MNSQPFVFRPGVGVDPELAQMQADTFGWQMVYAKQQPHDHPRPKLNTVPQAIGVFVILVGILWAMCAEARATVVGPEITVNFAWNNGSPQTSTVHLLFDHMVGTGQAAFQVSASASVPGASLYTGSQYYTGDFVTFDIGTVYNIEMKVDAGIVPSAWATNDYAFQPEAPITYHVLVKYPANNTTLTLTYSILQNGSIVSAGTHTQAPGDPDYGPVSVTVPTNDPITMIVQLPGYQQDGPLWVPTTDPTFIATVNVNTVAAPADNPPVPSTSTPAAVTTPDPTDLTNKLPPPQLVFIHDGIKPAPSTPAATTPSPTATPAPFDGTATANTNAATGGDIAKAANAQTVALNAVAAAQTTAANGVVTATNNVASEVNQNSSLNAAAAALAHQDSQAIQTLLTGDPVTVPAAPDPTHTTAAWVPGTASTVNTGIIAKLPTAPTFSTLTAAHIIGYTIKIPKGGGETIDVTESIDLSQDPWATPIAIFRGACLIVMTLTFFLVSFYTVRGALASK